MNSILLKEIIEIEDTWYIDKIFNFENLLANNANFYDTVLDRKNFGMYYYSKSANKEISTLIRNVLDNNVLENRYKLVISSIIKSKFESKWTKLLDTIKYQYDMGKPFNMVVNEETTNTLESSETYVNNRTSEESGTNETIESKDNTNNSVYGFNSLDAVPSDKSENTFNDKNSNTYNSSIGESKSSNYERSNPTTRDTTRLGNIGNIPTQDLLEREREVLTYQLWDTMCKDLDTVLTRRKYNL